MGVGTEHASVQPCFGTVMRGYDRAEVDGFLVQNAARLARLERELADAQRLRLRAVRRAEELEGNLRAARADPMPADADSSFGVRAEKLIRLAEQEAAEVRTDARRDAAAILEETRTEAAAHRNDVEQALIARETQLEQEVAQRGAGLVEQEERAADHLAAVREQTARIDADASRAADRIRADAEAAATALAEQAEAGIRERRAESAQELDRLAGQLAEVRAEMARLAGVLTAGSRND